jgi:hypothetical protein
LTSRLLLNFSQAGTYAIDSSDFASYTLSSQLYLRFSQAGTYAIDSSDFTGYTLSYQLYLFFSQAGTYSIDSSDFTGYTLSSRLYLNFSQAGTYAIDSSDFAAYTLSSTLYLSFSPAGTYAIDSSDFAGYTLASHLFLYFNTISLTKTIAAADFNGFIQLPTVEIEMGLTSTEADDILLGFYGAFPSKTNTGGTIDLAGNGNAAPSGTYKAQVPPTTGKEAAYELINDSGGVSANHWASITVEGGLP